MKCFYYKWVKKQTGETIMANFGWAESFAKIKAKDETKKIACVEINREEFRQLRKKGY